MLREEATVRNQGRILVVDDDPQIVKLITDYLTAEGYTVDAALHGADALMAASEYRPDVVLLDVRMEGLNGVAVLDRLHAMKPAVQVVMMTAIHDATLQQKTRSMGAFDYVIKPFTLSQLLQAVVAALAGSNRPPTPLLASPAG
jgi:DNA-binding response OmpR family regulator